MPDSTVIQGVYLRRADGTVPLTRREFRYELQCCRDRCGGGCRASALVREGSLMGCDPEMCAFYEGGYENRIRKTVDYAIERYCISQKEIS